MDIISILKPMQQNSFLGENVHNWQYLKGYLTIILAGVKVIYLHVHKKAWIRRAMGMYSPPVVEKISNDCIF